MPAPRLSPGTIKPDYIPPPPVAVTQAPALDLPEAAAKEGAPPLHFQTPCRDHGTKGLPLQKMDAQVLTQTEDIHRTKSAADDDDDEHNDDTGD